MLARNKKLKGWTARTKPNMITLPNGAMVSFRSGERPDNLYGEDVYAVLIDEATRLRPESWHAVRSTLTSTRGPIRAVANVTDRKNWFYELARRAESGEPGYAFHKITARDAAESMITVTNKDGETYERPVIDPAEIEDAKRDLPEHIYKALYECVAPEGGCNPFGTEAEIAACIKPASDAVTVAWGWDLARDRNWTVGIGLDEDCNWTQFRRWHGLNWQQQIPRILEATGDCRGFVDATGPGSGPAEALTTESGGLIKPFVFGQRSKQEIMESLSVRIHRGTIGIPNDPVMESELNAFEYSYSRTGGVKYGLPESSTGHDDTVDALALALANYTAQFVHGKTDIIAEIWQ